METVRCEGCHTAISSNIELSMGICNRCSKLLETGKGYAAICWNCDSIISIQEIPRHLRGAFTENTLFAPKCEKCGGTKEDSISWITFNKFNPKAKFIEDYINRSPRSRKIDHKHDIKIIYDI